MADNGKDKTDPIERLKKLVESLPGEKPDYGNLEKADPDKTEEQYQEEQRQWMARVRQKKQADAFWMHPIGRIRKEADQTWIEIQPRYREALAGLSGFSHIHVLFWFHENDTPEKRNTLKVHPRKDTRNPLTGVFATHSPLRPNLVGLTLCRILAVENTRIRIESIDAIDQTPVVDIKCYIPYTHQEGEVQVPDWV